MGDLQAAMVPLGLLLREAMVFCLPRASGMLVLLPTMQK